MSDALPLPPRPNLGQYKKLAKDLQGACKTGDIGAIRQWAAHWIETLARLKGTASSSTPREREREAEQIERRGKGGAHPLSSLEGKRTFFQPDSCGLSGMR